jgi:hypothetical protein
MPTWSASNGSISSEDDNAMPYSSQAVRHWLHSLDAMPGWANDRKAVSRHADVSRPHRQ